MDISHWCVLISYFALFTYQPIVSKIRVHQNSINSTDTGLNRCQIIKYSGLSDGNYTDLHFQRQYFVTVPILGLYS